MDSNFATQAVLLRRRGLVFVDGDTGEPPPPSVQPTAESLLLAIEIEWAALGYVPSERLRRRLRRVRLERLVAVRAAVSETLAERLGAGHQYEPLFRSFPDGIPDDTFDLWVRKVLSHFFQENVEQPCLFCRAIGTTHVLDPCLHVVCDRCFDGASYSACPVCEHKVDRSSPFFKPAPERLPSLREKVRFKLLDLGDRLDQHAQELVRQFCERKQAMSPADRADLETLVLDYGINVLPWLPERIPVKENVAIVIAALFRTMDAPAALSVAQRYLKTATDVLRFLAVYSGADASLLPETRFVTLDRVIRSTPRWADLNRKLDAGLRRQRWELSFPMQACRFKMARIPRPLRRALLTILESFTADTLIEDMRRHRSYWVWAGEFLHPHEYAKRFPRVARAFQIVRKFAPDGSPAPKFEGFNSRFEAAVRLRDPEALLAVLDNRPGEIARRFDHAVRVAGNNEDACARITQAFINAVPRMGTPVLLNLYQYLPTRIKRAVRRVYWPKGAVTTGVYAPDGRSTLPQHDVARASSAIRFELLRRFAEKPAIDDFVVDSALTRILVPFNERTASRAAVSLPRGSVVPAPRDKVVRLFLYWREPEKGGRTTDIDLSVGFYTETWRDVGVCSYYQLKTVDYHGATIAVSGGDKRNAPYPGGSCELIDVDWGRALAAGIRYAVMVVNNYSGMPFSQLDRGFAGLMLRDQLEPGKLHGAYFDPSAVELKFDLQGDNGIYMPLVFDLRDGVLHWLDVYSEGMLEFNNVERSRRAITNICPTLMEYFASGVRPTLYQLALLHGAARSRRVHIRSEQENVTRRFERMDGEEPGAFLDRIERGEGGEAMPAPSLAGGASVMAALYEGDLDLPDNSPRYVLFPERTASTVSASDLLS